MADLHAKQVLSGGDYSSKKAFKLGVLQDEVRYTVTDLFHTQGTYTNKSLPDGMHYVCGPNPYTNRRWYATVEKRDGKVTVK